MKHFYCCLLLWSGLAYGQENAVRTIGEAPDTSAVFVHVTQFPEPPGGMLAFQKSLVEQITYPPAAIADRAEGRVFVEVIVEKNGQLLPEHVQVIRGVHPALDEEALRVMRRSPRWRPGAHEGQLARVKMVVPIFFVLMAAGDEHTSNERLAAASPLFKEEAELLLDESFTRVDTPPTFKKGKKDFHRYIQKKLVYPAQALVENAHGRVLVGFVVDTNGAVKDVSVIRGVHPALDEEAARVIRESPRWNPGYYNGKPIEVRLTSNISFWLGNENFSSIQQIPLQELINSIDTNKTYASLSTREPFFVGGRSAFFNYVFSNIDRRILEQAKKGGFEGDMLVEFVVNTDGHISDARVIRGVTYSLDQDVIRLIRNSPKWVAAMHENAAIARKVELTFRFR